MALMHQAKLTPTKLELLAAWLPARPWYQQQDGAGIERVASCRFDDPQGEVGIETMLVRAGDGPVLHVPLTYRGAPLEGADEWLVGTCDHSVLGPRWVYDACGDPVYAAALASAIVAGTGEAEEFVQIDGVPQRREPAMTVTGSGLAGTDVPVVGAVRRVGDGDPTVIVTDAVELSVVRVVADGAAPAGAALTGSWPGLPRPVLLASARVGA